MRALLSWVRGVEGLRLMAPGGLGGQCVDLCNLYLLNVAEVPLVRANAVDWEYARIPGFAWEDNAPANTPPAGSVVVWGRYAPGAGTGVNGHVAVALVASPMTLLSVDQNWHGDGRTGLVLHTYAGVLGWHRPAGVKIAL